MEAGKCQHFVWELCMRAGDINIVCKRARHGGRQMFRLYK